MDIADIATQDYVEVPADERLGQLRTVFDDGRPKGVVLVEDGDYAGVVTQKSFLQSHIDDGAKAAALRRHAPAVDRHEDVREVARVLVEGGTTVAPVYEGDSLWGIVTEDDILEAVLPNLDAITVGQIHSEDVVTVTDDATVGQAINRLREHGISRLPVLDGDGLLTGVLTAHDLVAFATRNEQRSTRGERSGDVDRMLDLPVYDVMSSPVVTVAADETVRAAVERMLDDDFSGLVVTPAAGGGEDAADGERPAGPEDGDGTVAGVVTKTDVLRALTYTDEDHMDVQITNIDLLDADRSHVRESIEAVVDKYQRMQVRHAHVRLHEHKEKLRGTPLVLCKIRLRTNRGQIAGSGEGYGAKSAFHVALDTLERNVLEVKGVHSDEEYRGQLLRKMGEL